MLDRLIHFVLNNKLMVIFAGIILLVAGFFAWKHLPIDAFPDVTNVQVMILAEAPGLAPAEVERLVTFPIEVEMGGLPHVKQVRSLSKSGLSQVIIIFEDNADTYFTRQLVFERLASARGKLPQGVEPEMGPISTGLGEIYQYALESGYYCKDHPQAWSQSMGNCKQCGKALVKSKYDLTDLRTLQNWQISPQLRRLPGVNEVNSFGGYVKQFHVIPDPVLLLKYGISLREILEALEANNSNASGGFIVKDWEQINLVSAGLIKDIPDIEQIVLKAEDGMPVYLKDVAQVRLGHQTRFGAVTKDGKGETVIGMAIMLKDANSKEVVDRIKAEIPEIQKTLPAGVKITPFYDRTGLIQACIETVSDALVQGIILAIIVLFIVLWNFRAAFSVAMSYPLTMSATFILMWWQGITANLMSLAGLVVATNMLDAGVVVIVENIARHLEEKRNSALSKTAIAYDAVREVARPVFFSMLTIVIVILPLFALESMEGKMFKPMAITMCFTLAGSVVVCMLFIPALATMLLVRKPSDDMGNKENVVTRIFYKIYLPILSLSLRGRWMTVAIAASLMVGALTLIPRIGTEFLPPLDEGAIAINVVRLPMASLEGSALQATEIEKRLLAKFPEIVSVVSKTGRAEIAEDPMGPEQNDVLIMLKPREEWKTVHSKEELVQAVNRELMAIPGIRPAFSQPIALRVNELVSGIKSDVAIKIFGDNIDTLKATAERIAAILPEIEGAKDVKLEQVSGFSQLEIQMNRPEMARHKINVADVNLLIETAVGGKVATTMFEGQKHFDVLVRFPLEYRNDTSALERLLVPSPGGYNVPLSSLAAINEVQVPVQISREDSARRLIVECNVRGRDIGSFVAEAKKRLAEVEKGLPQGYRLVWGGQFENQQRAMSRLRLIVPAALLLIFLMLYSSLNSFKSSLLVLLNLPFALIGGIVALYWLKINLSVAASVGFIVLFGVAVETGMVLVSTLDQLRSQGKSAYVAVFTACKQRALPLIATNSTTILGLLPMIYATGAGSEIQKPLVVVIFGGLISSLGLTLIILPVIYSLFNEE